MAKNLYGTFNLGNLRVLHKSSLKCNPFTYTSAILTQAMWKRQIYLYMTFFLNTIAAAAIVIKYMY